MDYIFLDTNALIKLYIPEKGSTWLGQFVIGKQITLSELSLFESATTLARLYLESKYTIDQVERIYTDILTDCANYNVVPLDSKQQGLKVFRTGASMPTALRLRTLDTIQLASATSAFIDFGKNVANLTFTFVSSDTQLLRVAQVQGFTIENPENYL